MLRFKKEDGSSYPDWDEKGFYDVFELLQNNTFSRDMLNYDDGEVQNVHYGDVLVKYGDVLDCEKELLPFINSDVSVKKYNAQSYIKDGDVVLADTAEDFTAGKVTEVCNVGDKKILSGLHTMLCRPKEEFAKGFLGHYLNSNAYHKQIIPLLVGTKVYSINKKVIGDTTLKIPCMEEQTKIADSLSAIDEKISIQESVISDLEDIKKGTMQKIFNRAIRFKDDDGNEFPEWEEKRLGDYVTEMLGGASLTPKDILEEGDYKIIPKKAIQAGGKIILNDNCKWVKADTYKKYPNSQINKDYLLVVLRDLVPSGPSIGYVVGNDKVDNGILAQGVYGLKLSNELSGKYLIQYSNTPQYRKLMQTIMVGSTQVHIRNTIYLDIKLFLPCLEEQKKIADCLFGLDKKIEVEKKVLEDWRQMKKALLQQMFV